MDMLYRGSTLPALNHDEFRTHSINGNSWPIYFATMTEDERDRTKEDSSLSFYRVKGIDVLDDFIAGTEEVEVTGGLTPSLGTANNFSHWTTDPGLVIHVDADNIPAETIEIDYLPEWFDDHPGVAAHVSTLVDGEIHVNVGDGEDHQLWGSVGKNSDGSEYIQYWGDDARVDPTGKMYEDENEVIALAREIDLDATVKAAVGYYEVDGVSTWTLGAVLADLPGYEMMWGRGDVQRVDSMDFKERAVALYEETAALAQWPEEDIYLVGVHDQGDLRSGHARVTKEAFVWAYDGEGFIEDYDEAGGLVGGFEVDHYPDSGSAGVEKEIGRAVDEAVEGP